MIFGRNPATIVAGIQAILIALTSFHALDFIGINGQDGVALVIGVVTAVGAVVLAYKTNETVLAPVVEVFKATLALTALYGFSLNAEQTAAIIAAITMTFGMWQHTQVSPLAKGTFALAA